MEVKTKQLMYFPTILPVKFQIKTNKQNVNLFITNLLSFEAFIKEYIKVGGSISLN